MTASGSSLFSHDVDNSRHDYGAGLMPNTIGVVAVQWGCWQDAVDVASQITGTPVQEAAGALEGRSAIPSGPVSSIP